MDTTPWEMLPRQKFERRKGRKKEGRVREKEREKEEGKEKKGMGPRIEPWYTALDAIASQPVSVHLHAWTSLEQ